MNQPANELPEVATLRPEPEPGKTFPGEWVLHHRAEGYRVFASRRGLRVKADAAVGSITINWSDLHDLERLAVEEELGDGR